MDTARRGLLHHLVVIGASAGGVDALARIVAALPPGFPAIVAVVLHIGRNPSILPALLAQRGPNPARHAVDGEAPRPGHIYIAPPDRHLLVEPGRLRLSRTARENFARPAIDPLFRTAALGWRERAIGVVLTGDLDDGTAGLMAIRQCGGAALVQDPAEAASPRMPASALAYVPDAQVLPVGDIAARIVELVSRGNEEPGTPPPDLQREQDISEGQEPIESLREIGRPSGLTCPECGGGLVEVSAPGPLRYRCHTGHAYTALVLEAAQGEAVDQALWSSVRALRERETLLLRMATVAEAMAQPDQVQAGRAQAARVREQIRELLTIVKEPPT